MYMRVSIYSDLCTCQKRVNQCTYLMHSHPSGGIQCVGGASASGAEFDRLNSLKKPSSDFKSGFTRIDGECVELENMLGIKFETVYSIGIV